MPTTANPRAPIPDSAVSPPRQPIPVPHKSSTDQDDQTESDQTDERSDTEAARPVDPLAPGGSLFDEDDDAIEPNEPA
ncbi:MAG: hypothetical protein ABI658_09600 [Acidimicrobiales bacterium]